MCSNASITEILGINDNNLVILGNEKEKIKGIEYTVLRGKLSYRPTFCPKCGIVNENYDIIKNGSQTVKILFNRVNTNPLILMVKKQRFFCKHCESTFMAKTPIVDRGCFISNDVKRSIVLNLCETKSMDLIAREHCVSPISVARILRLTEDRRRKNYLPRVLSIDEFKSVNTVDASMSVNLTDLEGGHIFDILADRRQRYLFEYFNSYSLKVRKRVEYVTTDMYRPYIDLAERVFPNANIVVDKFHIVQLLTRELNKLRINEMKKLNTRSRDYKVLKRYWKIPLTRNWELNRIYFYKNRHFKNMTSSIDILDYMLKEFPHLKEAYDFYQNFLLSISKNDVDMLEDILNTRVDEIPMCFRKSIKSLKKLRKYVLNSLKYDYTNAMVEGKNNKIKVIKRVSYGYRSFRNFKARIMLMERYKIQKGNIHSYQFAMDAAV